MNKAKIYDLKKRAFLFSIAIIKFLENLPKDYIAQTVGKQLLRCATSIGANIVEAYAAASKKDFANFYRIALKSANETKYWLLLIKHTDRGGIQELDNLLNELDEISKILARSILTMKKKKF